MFEAQARVALAVSRRIDLNLGVGNYTYFEPDAIALSGNATIVKGNRKDGTGKFISDFNVLNLTGEISVKTGSEAYPVSLFWDYAVNTGAKKDAAGKKENTGLYTGVQIGRGSVPGEVSLNVAFIRTRQDAVLSTFAFSDVPSDGREGGMVTLGIPVLSKTVVNATGIFTRRINATGVAPENAHTNAS